MWGKINCLKDIYFLKTCQAVHQCFMHSKRKGTICFCRILCSDFAGLAHLRSYWVVCGNEFENLDQQISHHQHIPLDSVDT